MMKMMMMKHDDDHHHQSSINDYHYYEQGVSYESADEGGVLVPVDWFVSGDYWV